MRWYSYEIGVLAAAGFEVGGGVAVGYGIIEVEDVAEPDEVGGVSSDY